MIKKIAIILLAIMPLVGVMATNYVVTNTANSGSGSLRYALQMCMTAAGPHNISFNIPTSDAGYNSATGVWVISPSSVLPMVMQNNVTIDGTTQATFAGNINVNGPEIVLDGGYAMDYGLRIFNASNAVVKGLNIRGFTKGIQVYNSPNCRISGCYIGVDETASDTLSNDIGLEFIAGSHKAIIGGTSADDRNIISGNRHIGIRLLDVDSCKVCGCFIGTDRTGTRALPNYDGMSMEGVVRYCTIGGTTTGERNIISGNTDYGLPLFGVGATGNVIIGNYIGTDITGTQPVGNTYGVLFDDGSFGNRVGGSSAAERNIISGNVGYGVFFYNNGTHNNRLINNYIGTDHTGTSAVPNTAGIIIDGISYKNIIDGNVISGNTQVGVGINITGSDSNVLIRNKIGVSANGSPLGNGMDGIRISQGPKQTVIGGSAAEGNIIANNGGCGVYITNDNCKRNLISCNSFYNNGGLAIDLFSPGVNANDVGDIDDGANCRLNYPVINLVSWSGGVMPNNGSMLVEGTLDTKNPEKCEVQLYRAVPDPTGRGEGKHYFVSVTPASDGSWSALFPDSLSGDYITALTIDSLGNTSEFSHCRNTAGPAGLPSAAEGMVKVFPNPATDEVYVKTSMAHTELAVIDLVGVTRISLTGGNVEKIDVSALPAGIYLLQIKSGNAVLATHKIVRQ
ncbi:MAG: right-handed parallel beta-helix repeat-containing protein [Bacteroidales bacterium]|nr:right-handed parallel beta-helix repeat-containing protein [Bacteroidales bacterium]